MNQLLPILWLIFIIILGVVEAVTTQMVSIWFVVGAVGGLIASLLGAPQWLQFTVFVVVSAVTLIATRPLLKNVLKVRETRTNADSMIGRIGTVITEITDDSTAGRVSVGGLDWAAVAENGEYIEKDSKVLIKSIEGVKVIVERII